MAAETARLNVPPPPGAPPPGVGGRAAGDLTQELIDTDIWTDDMVSRAGIPIVDVPLVSVGAGIGSFVLIDFLRVGGSPTSSIRALGRNEVPWQTYKYLTGVSQIPIGERLRSDSGSTPDCIWGFPSYAIREALHEKGGLTKKLAPVWNVFSEPIFTDYYTPKAGQAFDTMAREAERIGWNQMLVRGLVRMVRRRNGGGYFTILTPDQPGATKRIAYRSQHVHLSVGYPGLRFLPDLQDYRTKYDDHYRVVNAYEPHEHVYEELNKHPGTVVVRGAGIVASRILQRLIDDRDNKGSQIQIAHLFRTYVSGKQDNNIFKAKRPGANGWSYQGFNWPKAAWGGQLRDQLENASDDERRELFKVMGGTTTPRRKLWKNQLTRGRAEGWYKEYIGEVDDVYPGDNGVLVTRIKGKDGLIELAANFIIDATGLEADVREHRILADLLDHSGARTNILGKLHVEPSYEILGARSGNGRMYAVGGPTLGSYYAGVDSFLGLQYAGLRVADDLASVGFGKKIGPVHSVSQWWKWALGRPLPA